MGIFISYSSTDSGIANEKYNYFQARGIDCYLDSYDEALARSRGTRRLTDILVERIGEHDTLFAIVTPNTKTSWWVPFEIGTARQMPRVITSFTNVAFELPEYLKEWPILRTNSDLDKYIFEYKEKRRTLVASLENLQENRMFYDSTYNSVRGFEQSVMAALGQRGY